MVVIGITGGIASGKSFVARELGRLGAEILDADRVGHAVLRTAAVRGALRERWGDEVIGQDGQVDRVAVSQRVFAPPPDGPRELEFLECLTHPRIGKRIRSRIEQLTRLGEVPAAVLDAPVLLKTGWDAFCNLILFVDVPLPLRLARAVERGWTPAEFSAREAAQTPVEEKQRRANATIDNSGVPARTVEQIVSIWQMLETG